MNPIVAIGYGLFLGAHALLGVLMFVLAVGEE